MSKLVYINNISLDGYFEDDQGALNWAPPDADVFAATTALMKSFGTYLYGRRLYESMAHWETDPSLAAQSELTAAFAKTWQAADKIVYSTTLKAVSTDRTQLEESFDPAAVRALTDRSPKDVTIGGANLAAQALKAGILNECHLIVWPMTLGGGKRALPEGVRTNLELLDEHRFKNGVVHLRYRAPT